MTKVHLLDEYTINQIAAGEIIENPASIIKELIENSMDANSSAITVEIKGGGVQFIRVTDNGIGMSADDAKLALQRHATSKISNAGDLALVSTLGFRGEALASIAAVTQFEMLTRPRNSISGIQIISHGGELIDVAETGCPEGTTIIVRNLFYNTPARLKFLKSTRAESAKISDLMGRLIIANPNVSIKYINSGKTVYHSPGNGRLISAIMSVYGTNISEDLIEVDMADPKASIGIMGFLGKPSIARGNRIHQSFFVNNRYIDKSNILTRAIEEAYREYLTVNTFPWVVLHISIPADQIDVNIHPAKTEIRFRDEEYIYDIVYSAVARPLEAGNYIPNIITKRDHATEEESITISPSIMDRNSASAADQYELDEKKYTTKRLEDQRDIAYKNSTDYKDSAKIPAYIEEKKSVTQKDSGKECINSQLIAHNIDREIPYRIIGTFLSTYILIERGEDLFIVDQHAAHERILYEKFKEARLKNEVAVQIINPPMVIDVTHNERSTIERSIDVFAGLGFDIDSFGGNTFIIRGVPAFLQNANIKELFLDILDNVDEDSISKSYIIDEDHIITCACKRAVKAHDPLAYREINALFKELENTEIKQLTCPHGRPIMIKLTRYELEKYFKRII